MATHAPDDDVSIPHLINVEIDVPLDAAAWAEIIEHARRNAGPEEERSDRMLAFDAWNDCVSLQPTAVVDGERKPIPEAIVDELDDSE